MVIRSAHLPLCSLNRNPGVAIYIYIYIYIYIHIYIYIYIYIYIILVVRQKSRFVTGGRALVTIRVHALSRGGGRHYQLHPRGKFFGGRKILSLNCAVRTKSFPIGASNKNLYNFLFFALTKPNVRKIF